MDHLDIMAGEAIDRGQRGIETGDSVVVSAIVVGVGDILIEADYFPVIDVMDIVGAGGTLLRIAVLAVLNGISEPGPENITGVGGIDIIPVIQQMFR